MRAQGRNSRYHRARFNRHHQEVYDLEHHQEDRWYYQHHFQLPCACEEEGVDLRGISFTCEEE